MTSKDQTVSPDEKDGQTPSTSQRIVHIKQEPKLEPVQQSMQDVIQQPIHVSPRLIQHIQPPMIVVPQLMNVQQQMASPQIQMIQHQYLSPRPQFAPQQLQQPQFIAQQSQQPYFILQQPQQPQFIPQQPQQSQFVAPQPQQPRFVAPQPQQPQFVAPQYQQVQHSPMDTSHILQLQQLRQQQEIQNQIACLQAQEQLRSIQQQAVPPPPPPPPFVPIINPLWNQFGNELQIVQVFGPAFGTNPTTSYQPGMFNLFDREIKQEVVTPRPESTSPPPPEFIPIRDPDFERESDEEDEHVDVERIDDSDGPDEELTDNFKYDDKTVSEASDDSDESENDDLDDEKPKYMQIKEQTYQFSGSHEVDDYQNVESDDNLDELNYHEHYPDDFDLSNADASVVEPTSSSSRRRRRDEKSYPRYDRLPKNHVQKFDGDEDDYEPCQHSTQKIRKLKPWVVGNRGQPGFPSLIQRQMVHRRLVAHVQQDADFCPSPYKKKPYNPRSHRRPVGYLYGTSSKKGTKNVRQYLNQKRREKHDRKLARRREFERKASEAKKKAEEERARIAEMEELSIYRKQLGERKHELTTMLKDLLDQENALKHVIEDEKRKMEIIEFFRNDEATVDESSSNNLNQKGKSGESIEKFRDMFYAQLPSMLEEQRQAVIKADMAYKAIEESIMHKIKQNGKAKLTEEELKKALNELKAEDDEVNVEATFRYLKKITTIVPPPKKGETESI